MAHLPNDAASPFLNPSAQHATGESAAVGAARAAGTISTLIGSSCGATTSIQSSTDIASTSAICSSANSLVDVEVSVDPSGIVLSADPPGMAAGADPPGMAAGADPPGMAAGADPPDMATIAASIVAIAV